MLLKWLPLAKWWWLLLLLVLLGLKPPSLPPKPGAELGSVLEAVTVGLIVGEACSLDGWLSASLRRLSSWRS